MRVIVVEYSTHWPQAFESESSKLRSILEDAVSHIYHIGSTAVPGLQAKPIIDILLEVPSLARLDRKTEALENLGYEAMGELGIPGRRYFRKGGDNRTHQIHAFKTGDAHVIRHIAFRDYLIEHKNVAQAYGELKLSIAKNCNDDIEKYCDKKDSFVAYHESKALQWFGKKSPPKA